MKDTATQKDKIETVTHGGTVTVEPLHHLEGYWQHAGSPLNWDCLFMLPPWLGVWWTHFGKDSEMQLHVVTQHDAILGLAPLRVSGDTGHFISDSNLIDYSDFILAPSREREFFSTLFDHLRREGVSRFEMARIRADSKTVSFLRAHSTSLGCNVSFDPVDVLYEMDLPETWEGYLGVLSGKERHETRRKLRRLEDADHLGVRIVENKKDVSDAMNIFVGLFRSNRIEKAQFMTGTVESFFRSLAVGTAEAGLLKLFFLDVNDTPAAAAMCFDYQSTVYLYNNGYDRHFDRFSMGTLSNVFSIRECIKLGREKYNFLRGSETYKGRLGGHPVGLLHCEILLK